MSYQYLEVNGVKVLRKLFNSTKDEQQFMAMFPRKMEPGFITVHQWQPGNMPPGGSLTAEQRKEVRYISALDFYIAPVVNGKADVQLGAAEPGKAVSAPVNLEVPEEFNAMTDADLLTLAPRIGAKVSNRMERPQLLAAMSLATQKNPKNWESVRNTLAENALRRAAASPKPATITA